ncbi:MAG: SIS domain-containing protein [Desulfobacteraceae bacterium]|nr:SIS domain-containing protein [Desulfobacteraceae bacterium]
MNVQRLVEAVLDDTRNLVAKAPRKPVERFVQGLDQAERIFCGAQGRSGYVLRCFCMRLMHLGYRAYFAGETITPGVGAGDIVVVVSGSGQTRFTYEFVKLAQRRGVITYGVIGVEDSPVARALDHVICLPGGSKADMTHEPVSLQPLGSLFEQAAFVLLEAVVLELFQRQGSNHQALLNRHANLE